MPNLASREWGLKLQSNISYHYYPAGHMVYVNEQVLSKFHDDVAAFVKETESGT